MGTVLLGASLSLAAPQEPAKAPDNTKVNKRDRKAGEPTADQQKENQPDREIARKIRRAIVADKSLSTYAHNVKVIVQGGAVTLKGPVHTEEEKKAVEAKATEVAGSAKVTNQLSVKGDSARAKKTKTT
ncbi:MAG: BON domain-containing protein [Acidobacteriota bacterium]|nr:BON domain-containing protein [Acidobacteriota bacterium]